MTHDIAREIDKDCWGEDPQEVAASAGATCYADDVRTPLEKAKHTAQTMAVMDLKHGRSCDSSRHFARPGSAWDTWYTEKYQAVLKQRGG
ncbi:MAG: hypothetical protein JAY90_20020 [Candidatus Thiodiazotropha lotti]|nr:hypothetical protein [Candidatus Thiodiazotropha lotti]